VIIVLSRDPSSTFRQRDLPQSTVTIERLERAIKTTAKLMVAYPDLAHRMLPTLKRLQAEREELLKDGDPIALAKRILAA
jgi:hypothetical protein